MVKTSAVLPENYREKCKIDLQKDKKTALLVNVLSIVIAVLMVIPVIVSGALMRLYDSVEDGTLIYFLKMTALLAGMLAYFIVHELTHGIFMKIFSGVKPSFGVKLPYAYAGSSAYFNRKNYVMISLAPAVILGVLLMAAQLLLGKGWGIIVYVIQICNIAGSAGDFYVTFKILRMDKEILVNDTGVEMTVYEADK